MKDEHVVTVESRENICIIFCERKSDIIIERKINDDDDNDGENVSTIIRKLL